ncbi:unnamed protein product, partial [Allacma fusca]
MFSSIIYGILKETRTVLLYSVPVAILMFVLKHFNFAPPLLMIFISSLAYVFVILIEDRDSMDTKFTSFVARLGTAIVLYYTMKYAMYFIFENYNFVEAFKDEAFWLECIRLLREYIGFMSSFSVKKLFNEVNKKSKALPAQRSLNPTGQKGSKKNTIKMSTATDETEPLTPTKILDAFIKETRITLLYGLPLGLIVYLLTAISWDSSFFIVLLTMYAFVTIVANEDKETLDENLKTILICLATDISYYYLTTWVTYMWYGSYKLDKEYEKEESVYMLQIILLFREYITFVHRIAFFRIIVYAL